MWRACGEGETGTEEMKKEEELKEVVKKLKEVEKEFKEAEKDLKAVTFVVDLKGKVLNVW